MATQIGPKIGIDGEKEYRQQLKAIIDETKNLDASMAKTTSEWNANTSALAKNRAQAQNLVKQIAAQNDAVSLMAKMLDEAKNKFGEASSATQGWQRNLDLATKKLNELETELKGFHGAENFSDLDVQFANMGQKIQNMGQNIAMVGGVMSATITAPLVAIGKASIDMASDMTEASSKVDVIFGSMSESVKSFTDTSLEAYGVSNVKAMQMVGSFGAMATQMGISDKAAAEMATTLTGLAGDLAAFHNSELDITQTALEGIFTGQTRALTQFAGAINQANLEEFAAKQGKVYSQMSEAEKVMTRYQLVLERTADAQGNFAMTGGEYAGSMQKFQGAIEELKVAIGEHLLPIITPIVNHFTKLIQIFSNLPEPVQKVIVVVAAIVAAIGPLLIIVGTLMMSLGSIITQGPVIAAAFATMIPAIQGLAASFVELTVAAAPWLLLAAAIAAAGYLIYSNWDSISSGISNAASSISNAYHELMSLNNTLKDNVNSTIQDIIDYFMSLPSRIANALRQAVQAIKDEFKRMIQNAKQSGADFVSGFIEGIKSKVQPLIDQVKKIAKTIEDYLGFSTPDKGPLHKYGTWMPDFLEGLAKGIRQNEYIVANAMNGLAKTMALPLDSSASMNMALAGADGGSMSIGGTSMNVYVDHISDLQDLIRIQNQAQQRYRMGAR